MMKLAHFSPLPPQQSGIADYCDALLPYLAALMEVTVYSDDPRPTRIGWHAAQDFTAVDRFNHDLCLYHIGNNRRFHTNVYQTMCRFPSVALLHEFNLHGFYLHGSRPDYLREMGYAYGMEGLQATYHALQAREGVQLERFPLFERTAVLNRGLIVHTNQARQTILTKFPDAQVACIPHAALPTPPPISPKPSLLASLPANAVLLGSFGHLSSTKRLEIILPVLAALRPHVPPFCYLLVGRPVRKYSLTPLIRELGLADIVFETGFVTLDELNHYIRAIDIGLNLRTGPTGGEMSGTLMRLLAQGKPTVVSDVGGFADFPDEAVVKIRQDEGEVGELTAVLTQLLTNPSRRHQIGSAGQAYVEQHCSLPQVARQIHDFLQQIA